MKYIEVVNWWKHQHYSKRKPPWIKVYIELLDGDNLEYALLKDPEKIQLIHIWLLASRHDGVIPGELKWLNKRLNLRGRLKLDALVSAGFLRIHEDRASAYASMVASKLDGNAMPETETETDTDTQRATNTSDDVQMPGSSLYPTSRGF